jgi:hypothetical protein
MQLLRIFHRKSSKQNILIYRKESLRMQKHISTIKPSPVERKAAEELHKAMAEGTMVPLPEWHEIRRD